MSGHNQPSPESPVAVADKDDQGQCWLEFTPPETEAALEAFLNPTNVYLRPSQRGSGSAVLHLSWDHGVFVMFSREGRFSDYAERIAGSLGREFIDNTRQ